ncbi:DinB family protein [Dokdonia sinensis]|uniref:DinB family protein n=1 Tax=Dokdonia sinensis TaxID=2479847 RepID=A0A3M0G8A9_9FLAO|nr:DinB family protein [Dokdonia sinensis]RMB60638.1 DinB family protein [Dokdonia sinensis]
MRATIVQAINQNLQNAISLIDGISPEIYTDVSVGPYYSSIGSHLRHALDFFDCIIDGLQENKIDLTARKRDEVISCNPEACKNHIYEIQQQLSSFVGVNTDYLLHVTDNLGQGKVTIMYTLESILAQANTHATHHYAIISYMLQAMKCEVAIEGFGYNPSTPVPKREGI